MRKITSLIAGLSMLGWVVSTHASTINVEIAGTSTLDVTNVIYLGTEPTISPELVSTAITPFDLTDGSSKTIELFNLTITTDWLTIGALDVMATIDFESPAGLTTTFTDGDYWLDGLFVVSGTYVDGMLSWEPDSILTTLGDGTIFSVELQDISFLDSWDNNTIVVSATFSNLGVASVPEPSTLALMGFGLLAIGFSHRRRKV